MAWLPFQEKSEKTNLIFDVKDTNLKKGLNITTQAYLNMSYEVFFNLQVEFGLNF